MLPNPNATQAEDLVFESYGAAYAWLRPEPAAESPRYVLTGLGLPRPRQSGAVRPLADSSPGRGPGARAGGGVTAEVTDLAVPLLARQIDMLAEAVATLAATAQQPSEPLSSVELVQNAKSVTQITVKVYHRDPHQAVATARCLYDELVATYRTGEPVSDGTLT